MISTEWAVSTVLVGFTPAVKSTTAITAACSSPERRVELARVGYMYASAFAIAAVAPI
jgi:hypothetical protein